MDPDDSSAAEELARKPQWVAVPRLVEGRNEDRCIGDVEV
jgi:hypothetical protein